MTNLVKRRGGQELVVLMRGKVQSNPHSNRLKIDIPESVGKKQRTTVEEGEQKEKAGK